MQSILGISSNSRNHTCPYMEGEMTLQAGSLRTYRSLNSWYAKFKAAGSNMKNMQHFSD